MIQFIFNYKDNLVVFMTDISIISIDFSLFRLQNHDNIIISKPTNEYQFHVEENCLFRKCGPKKTDLRTTTKRVYTKTTIHGKNQTRDDQESYYYGNKVGYILFY